MGLLDRIADIQNYDEEIRGIEKGRLDAREIPVAKIDPNPYQPRLAIEEARLEELAASIESEGLCQPILVSPRAGRYVVIAGHRRLAAFKRLGRRSIPATVRKGVGDEELMLLAYIENAVRVDLDVFEQSEALHRLLKALGSQSEVAKRTGLDKSIVSRRLRLRRLSPRIVEDIRARATTTDYSALATIAGVDDELEQWRLYRGFLERGRAWLDAEARRQKSGGNRPVKTKQGTYIPGVRLSLSRRLASRLDDEKMRKVLEYAERLAEGEKR